VKAFQWVETSGLVASARGCASDMTSSAISPDTAVSLGFVPLLLALLAVALAGFVIGYALSDARQRERRRRRWSTMQDHSDKWAPKRGSFDGAK